MTDLPRRVARAIAQLPRRILAAAGWPYLEPTGFGVTSDRTGDLEEMEAERRRQREVWRRGDDEDDRPSST